MWAELLASVATRGVSANNGTPIPSPTISPIITPGHGESPVKSQNSPLMTTPSKATAPVAASVSSSSGSSRIKYMIELPPAPRPQSGTRRKQDCSPTRRCESASTAARPSCSTVHGGGSELVRRGVRWRSLGLRFDAPTVQAVHQEYLAAGADVLRTNTFQLNRRIYQDVFRDRRHMRHIGAPDLDQRVPELVPRAVQIARGGTRGSDRPEVPIAGVMSPLEHCFRPDLAPDFATRCPSTRRSRAAGPGRRRFAAPRVDELRGGSPRSSRGGPCDRACRCGSVPGRQRRQPAQRRAPPAIMRDAILVNCAPPADIDTALDKDAVQGRLRASSVDSIHRAGSSSSFLSSRAPRNGRPSATPQVRRCKRAAYRSSAAAAAPPPSTCGPQA